MAAHHARSRDGETEGALRVHSGRQGIGGIRQAATVAASLGIIHGQAPYGGATMTERDALYIAATHCRPAGSPGNVTARPRVAHGPGLSPW